jgi:hypothetical protein
MKQSSRTRGSRLPSNSCGSRWAGAGPPHTTWVAVDSRGLVFEGEGPMRPWFARVPTCSVIRKHRPSLELWGGAAGHGLPRTRRAPRSRNRRRSPHCAAARSGMRSPSHGRCSDASLPQSRLSVCSPGILPCRPAIWRSAKNGLSKPTVLGCSPSRSSVRDTLGTWIGQCLRSHLRRFCCFLTLSLASYVFSQFFKLLSLLTF